MIRGTLMLAKSIPKTNVPKAGRAAENAFPIMFSRVFTSYSQPSGWVRRSGDSFGSGVKNTKIFRHFLRNFFLKNFFGKNIQFVNFIR